MEFGGFVVEGAFVFLVFNPRQMIADPVDLGIQKTLAVFKTRPVRDHDPNPFEGLQADADAFGFLAALQLDRANAINV